jgi:hypothetical protein
LPLQTAGRLGGATTPDAGLRVSLQFVQRDINRFAVHLPHPVIAADERGQQHRLGGAEGGVPTRAMFYRSDGLTVFGLVAAALAREDIRPDKAPDRNDASSGPGLCEPRCMFALLGAYRTRQMHRNPFLLKHLRKPRVSRWLEF